MKFIKFLIALAISLTMFMTPADADATCGGATGTVQFRVDFPSSSPLVTKAPWTENATVSLAMRNLEELGELQFETEFSCPFGDLVSSIDGVSPDKEHYWALMINDHLSRFGIDSTVLRNGDSVRLSMMEIPGN